MAAKTASGRWRFGVRTLGLLLVGLGGSHCGTDAPGGTDSPRADATAQTEAGDASRDGGTDVTNERRDEGDTPADANDADSTATAADGGPPSADAAAEPEPDRRNDALDAATEPGHDGTAADGAARDATNSIDANADAFVDASEGNDRHEAGAPPDVSIDPGDATDTSAPADAIDASDVCVATTITCPPDYECGSIVDECGKTIACAPGCSGPQDQCIAGQCVCVPKNCAAMPAGSCGVFDDGCGSTIQCTCAAGQLCVENACAGDHLSWIRTAGGTGARAIPLAVTSLGDSMVVTGYFSSSIDVGTYHLTSAGGAQDIFVAKYDQLGNVQWAKSAGGTGDDVGIAVTAANGHIVVVGSFQATAVFGPTTTLQSNGGRDTFIVKYDQAGNIVWAKSFGASGDDEGSAAAIGPSDTILVAGGYRGTVQFDSTHALTAVGNVDTYVAKYDAAGNLLWVMSEGGAGNDFSRALAIAPDGRFALMGLFNDTCVVGEGSNTQTLSAGPSNYDPFVASYDASGQLVWAKQIRSTASDAASAVAMDAQANVYAVGSAGGTVEFGPGVGFTTAPNSPDVFLAKYDASGTALWAVRGESTGNDTGADVALASDGSILWTGYFLQTIAMGRSTVLGNLGAFDVYVARHDTSGNLLWATRQGRSAIEVVTGLTTFADGSWGIVGYFDTQLGFGAGAPRPAIGEWTMYVARFAP